MFINVIDYRKEQDISDWPLTQILEERIEIGRIDRILYREIRLLPDEAMRRIALELESRIRGAEAELHICESQRTSLQKLQYIFNKWNDPSMEFWGRPMKEKLLIQRKSNLSTLHDFIELEDAIREKEPTAEELSEWLQEHCTPKSQMALLLLQEVSPETLQMASALLRERASELEPKLHQCTNLQSDEARELMMRSTHLVELMKIVVEEIERRLRHEEEIDDEEPS